MCLPTNPLKLSRSNQSPLSSFTIAQQIFARGCHLLISPRGPCFQLKNNLLTKQTHHRPRWRVLIAEKCGPVASASYLETLFIEGSSLAAPRCLWLGVALESKCHLHLFNSYNERGAHFGGKLNFARHTTTEHLSVEEKNGRNPATASTKTVFSDLP